MESLFVRYTQGTYRLLSPKQTLARITPTLKKMGITRCAEVTGLDVDLGVPTYCAIRPQALVLQTSNGKGLTHESAQVSALMEAIELYHAENPDPVCLQRGSLKQLVQAGLKVIHPQRLFNTIPHFFSDDYILDWVAGEDLLMKQIVWLPASVAYFCQPTLYRTTTNGLASGNHLVEATLHALYELIERDAISKIEVDGYLKIKEQCRIVDTTTIANQVVQKILKKLRQAQSKLILLWIPTNLQVHTFWAILLNQSPFSAVSTFNVGYGSHLDINVAAVRAITEAIQSRLSIVHGAREDIIKKPVYNADWVQDSLAYHYFDGLSSNTHWNEVATSLPSGDLGQHYTQVLDKLIEANHSLLICVNLTKPQINIPVVKVIVPSLQFKSQLF